MIVTKLVQSTILIDHEGTRILVDPGSYNPAHGVTTDELGHLDALIITHKHTDHFDPNWTRELYQRYRPRILTNVELALELGSEGLGTTIVRPGERYEAGDLEVITTLADHQVRGEAIANFGLVVSDGRHRLYHTSDTGLIESRRLNVPEAEHADVMMLPISNRGVVMGIDDALHMTADFKPKIAVPMHYESPKDAPRVKPQQFVERLTELCGVLPGLQSVKAEIVELRDRIELHDGTARTVRSPR